ncbi:YigZ family protein [Aestuariirhabdus litorea]|uniref:YigZ family protein n=1 Tax=Aestuariirhabdus litorea TaxID=2528527 RepID=UPI0013E39B2A|nr:YigZ family protein [Aestuariirhabdus litorea]
MNRSCDSPVTHPYSVPTLPAKVELEIKRSRFIGLLEPVSSREQALAFLADVRQRYPDARHHCWAYRAGSARSPSAEACSDDGEPQGSAGRPMLNVLQQQAVSDLVVVVVRYFGGVKLGVGGLVRAYTEAVQGILEQSQLRQQRAMTPCQLRFDYGFEVPLRQLVERLEGRWLDAEYGAGVVLRVAIADQQLAAFKAQALDICRGQLDLSLLPHH